MKHASFLFVVVLGLSSCGSPPPSGCARSSECAAGQSCVDGACVDLPDAGAPLDAPCVCGEGESCASGTCVADCGDPLASACAAGDVCDYASGACVPTGTAGALTGEGVRCGASGPLCLPGTECTTANTCQPAPPCVAIRCTPDRSTCWGNRCASERPVAPCMPASVARMNEDDFIHGGDNGLVDLELDDACNAYGVTTISGTDYLRELAPDGTLTIHDGVTNLNMGEVAVLRPQTTEFETTPGEVALTYTCCLSCGCVGTDPQGVARLDRGGSPELPMVLTAVASDATGPFGLTVLDGGPYGLTWGRDRTLYVGNVAVDGDLHRADLDLGTSREIARLGARVHASTTFDGGSLLVALAGGEVQRVSVDGTVVTPFASIGSDVTSLVRDPFLGVVYLSLRDGSVVTRGPDGRDGGELLPSGQVGRIAYGPDGALYYLRTGFGGTQRIERIELPATRD